MKGAAVGALLALVFIMAAVCERLSERLFVRLGYDGGKNREMRFVCGGLSVLWVFFSAACGVWIPVMFSGYIIILAFRLLLYRQQPIRSVKLLMMAFIQFASSFLILLGGFSLFHGNIEEVTGNAAARSAVMAGAMLIVALFCLFPWERFSFQGIGSDTDEKDTSVFLGVLGCCCVYVFFDGFLCGLYREGYVAPLLLVSGNLLVFLLILLFFWNSYELAKNHFLEEEHVRIEAEKAKEKLKRERISELNNRDGLTGAYSRRYAMDQIRCLLRGGDKFTLIYIDLDGLKKVNDRMGHLEGDRYLMKFTEIMKQKLGGQGSIARIGGDEFLVIMPDRDKPDAISCMEQIRADMGAVSFSFGAAEGADCAEALIREADLAMYQDKKRIRGGERSEG